MGYFTRQSAVPVPVGIVEQVVVAAFPTRCEDVPYILLHNTSLTETFQGTLYSGPTSNGPWVEVTNDIFKAMGPGVSRQFTGDPLQHPFLRVLGYFDASPASVSVTLLLIAAPSWVAKSA